MSDKKPKTRRADARKKGLGIPAHHYVYPAFSNCGTHHKKTYYCHTCRASWAPCCEEKHP